MGQGTTLGIPGGKTSIARPPAFPDGEIGPRPSTPPPSTSIRGSPPPTPTALCPTARGYAVSGVTPGMGTTIPPTTKWLCRGIERVASPFPISVRPPPFAVLPPPQHRRCEPYRPRKLGIETIRSLKARYHPVGRDMAGLQPFGFIIMAETQAVGLRWHSPGRWPSATTRPVIHAVPEPMGSGPPFLCARCGPHFTKSEPLRQQMARGILPAHPDTDVRSSPSLHPAWDVALKGQSVWQSS